MQSFKLEKQSRKSVAGIFFFTLILGIFYHGALVACAVAGIVWIVMFFAKKESL